MIMFLEQINFFWLILTARAISRYISILDDEFWYNPIKVYFMFLKIIIIFIKKLLIYCLLDNMDWSWDLRIAHEKTKLFLDLVNFVGKQLDQYLELYLDTPQI